MKKLISNCKKAMGQGIGSLSELQFSVLQDNSAAVSPGTNQPCVLMVELPRLPKGLDVRVWKKKKKRKRTGDDSRVLG